MSAVTTHHSWGFPASGVCSIESICNKKENVKNFREELENVTFLLHLWSAYRVEEDSFPSFLITLKYDLGIPSRGRPAPRPTGGKSS